MKYFFSKKAMSAESNVCEWCRELAHEGDCDWKAFKEVATFIESLCLAVVLFSIGKLIGWLNIGWFWVLSPLWAWCLVSGAVLSVVLWKRARL